MDQCLTNCYAAQNLEQMLTVLLFLFQKFWEHAKAASNLIEEIKRHVILLTLATKHNHSEIVNFVKWPTEKVERRVPTADPTASMTRLRPPLRTWWPRWKSRHAIHFHLSVLVFFMYINLVAYIETSIKENIK